jgi:hypothetical protein
LNCQTSWWDALKLHLQKTHIGVSISHHF